MDCPRCTYVLEHPDRALAEAELWTDLPECCQETLQLVRLERGMRRVMPKIEPDASLDDAILAAARKHAKPMAAATMPLAPVRTSGTSWVARLRRWVTAPQVAMATITALAVVIGIFYVPSRERFLEAEGDTLMPVARESEPSLREEGAELAEAPAAAPSPARIAAKPPTPSAGSAESTALLRSAERSALAGRGTSGAAAESESRGAAGPANVIAQNPYGADSARRMAGDEESAASESLMRSDSFAASGGAATRSAAMPRAAAAPATAAPATAAPAPSRAAAPAAEIAAAPAPGSTDLLAQARALRSRGQCAAAVPVYEQFLAESSAGPRADATMELAGCYAATGRLDRARQLYTRATSYPTVAARAREELASLDHAIAARSATSTSTARARTTGSTAPSAAPAEAAGAAADSVGH